MSNEISRFKSWESHQFLRKYSSKPLTFCDENSRQTWETNVESSWSVRRVLKSKHSWPNYKSWLRIASRLTNFKLSCLFCQTQTWTIKAARVEAFSNRSTAFSARSGSELQISSASLNLKDAPQPTKDSIAIASRVAESFQGVVNLSHSI